MHKIMGQTLEKTAIKLSNEDKYKIWELQLLTVAISRVHKLKDNYIVGTKEEARIALNNILQIETPKANEITKRLNMLNVLNDNTSATNNNNNVNLSDRDMFMTMIDVTYTPPNYGFIYLSISRKHPYKTYFGTTNERLEKQIRYDNNGNNKISLCNEIWEIGCFIYGFASENERLGRYDFLKDSMNPQINDNRYISLWSLNKRLKEYVKTRPSSNLKFVQYCLMKKKLIKAYSKSNNIALVN